MRKIDPDFDQSMKLFQKYSILISEEKFRDPDTIKIYGENLILTRREIGLTLQEVALELGLHYQNLSEIEAGKRKEIDRDILLLLSGIYHKRPEVLMGMKPLTKDPMEFYSEASSKRANFIMRELYGTAPTLLHALLMMAELSPQKRKRLLEFMRTKISVNFLGVEQIKELIEKSAQAAMKQDPAYHFYMGYLNRNACYAALCELNLKSPELMNAYISIAHAGKAKYPRILEALVSAGFLEVR